MSPLGIYEIFPLKNNPLFTVYMAIIMYIVQKFKGRKLWNGQQLIDIFLYLRSYNWSKFCWLKFHSCKFSTIKFLCYTYIYHMQALAINIIFQTELLHATEVSMEPQPKAVLIKEIYDVRSWIATHLNDLHGHSQPHCFKFVLNRNGKALMFNRNWSSSQWCSEKDASIVLKVYIY